MTLIAPPQQLYEVLATMLVGRGFRYLRYLHLRAALRQAEGTQSVFSIGAGKSLAEVALALEFPDVMFTVTEHPKAFKTLLRARRLARRLELGNVRFGTFDLTSRRLPRDCFDLVAAVDTLHYVDDVAAAAAKMAALSRKWLYCQVPFASLTRQKDPLLKQQALREFSHRHVGFDLSTLLRLFPEPAAVRGCLWADGGLRLRDRLESMNDGAIYDNATQLLEQGDQDLRPGWQADRREAQSLWILSRVHWPSRGDTRGWLSRLLGRPRPNHRSAPWRPFDERRIIEISGMFDAEFYTRNYPEAGSGDPLGHYLSIGAAHGAWPNSTFDGAFYLRQSRLDPARHNPLAHYLLEGRAKRLPTCERENRAKVPSIVNLSPRPEAPPLLHHAVAPAKAPVAPQPIAPTPVKPADPRVAIGGSGLFDAGYYLKQNIDVAQKKVDPLAHFIRSGAREGRNPNSLFDTHYYAKLAGIDPGVVNPLLHYIQEGETRGLSPSPRFDPGAYRAANPAAAQPGLTVLAHALAEMQRQRQTRDAERKQHAAQAKLPAIDLQRLRVTIIVPVYNGGEHVRRCLDSVVTETRMPGVKLLVLDDASTDAKTVGILAEYATLPNVELRRSPENRGFTRNVNWGLSLTEREHDVVLLNSDTVVGPRWLEHLALAAYADPRTASATALSDNAGAFSTPEAEYNPTHVDLDVASAARLSRRAAIDDVQTFPTGSGFCMYLRRPALDAVGPFDAQLFPRGYGEENDWCLRAKEAGFHHVIALRSYVAHVNAVSFGAAKAELRQAARRVLEVRHPDYGAQLREAVSNATALKAQRAAFAVALAQRPCALPRILYVTSTRTGGVPQTNQDLMRGIGHLFSPLLLECNSRELTLWDPSPTEPIELECHELRERVGMMSHTSDEYDDVVRTWLVKYDVEVLHVRHIAWHSLGLVREARALQIPVVFSFHDFYSLCPSVNLIAGHERPQEGGVTVPHIAAPLWKGVDEEGHEQAIAMDPRAFIDMWRRRMGLMIDCCDVLVTTSRSAKSLIEAQLPAARRADGSFVVIPHGRDFDELLEPPVPPAAGERLRVLAAGNIAEAKGLVTFLNLLELDREGHIELHVVGGTKLQLSSHPRVTAHGRYKRGALNELIKKIRPHVSTILSVCPETFCHTLTESWAAGLPVLGSELGAVGERMRETGGGWTIDPMDAQAVLDQLYAIRAGAPDWHEKIAAVRKWQKEEATVRTVAAMSQDYLEIYRRVRSGNRPLLPGSRRKGAARPRVALVARDHYPAARPTVHVRLATPVRASKGNIAYEWVEATDLIRTSGADFDGVIVCRNASDGPLLAALADMCTKSQLPLVVDLDDDLLAVPETLEGAGRYTADLAGLEALLRAASLTTVTTAELAKTYSNKCREVRVSENALDRELWFGELAGACEPPSGWTTQARLRVLYVGTNTHGDDLSLVLSIFSRLAETDGVALHVVGVENHARPGYAKIRPPDQRYDRFVPWLRSVAPHFDVAIAPLVDSPFNRRKSPLKFMEYAACGLAVVASAVPPYSDIVRDGVDGLLATDASSWAGHLRRLAEDPRLRETLARNALARAQREFVATSCVFDTFDWRPHSRG